MCITLFLITSLSTNVFAQKPKASYKIMEIAFLDEKTDDWGKWISVQKSTVDLYDSTLHVKLFLEGEYFPSFTDFTRISEDIVVNKKIYKLYDDDGELARFTIDRDSGYTYLLTAVRGQTVTLIIKQF